MSKLLYIKISEQIIEQIVNGELKPGDKMLSVREYALKLSVNPKTVQKAFNYLSDKEIFVTLVGDGRFINEDVKVLEEIKKQVVQNEVENFIKKMKKYKFSSNEIIELIRKADYE